MSLASRSGWLAYGVALVVVALDQASKAWILGGLHLAPGAPIDVWGPLRLNLVSNEGVSFGLLQVDAPWTRWALAAFAVIVALALAGFVRRTEKPLTGLAFGLIIGGAVGNLLDRVRHGAVVDFIDVEALHFPWVFNLADSAITIGITLLLAESLFAPKKAPA
jgi:signal peptidase II